MLDKFIANVGEERLDGPEGARPDLLPGPDPRLDRRARGDARRGAADHRRRLPEPDRRHPGRQEQDPQRRPDGLLRDRHDRARQAPVRRLAGLRVLDAARGAARRTSPCPRTLQGYQTYQTPGLIPGPIATPSLPSIDAALEPDTADEVHLLPGHPRRRREARLRQDADGARREPARSTATSSDRAGPTAGATSPRPRRRPITRRWAEADRAARPARLGAPAGTLRRRRGRRLLRRPPRAHALPDRLRPRRGRGEGRRQLRPVPGRRRRGRRSSPTRATRSRPGARRPSARSSRPTTTCRRAGRSWSASVGARRVAVEAGFVSHAVWERLAAAAPDVELVPIEGWVEADRAVKEPAEIERIAAACAVADRALAALLPEIRPGVDRGGPRAPTSSG